MVHGVIEGKDRDNGPGKRENSLKENSEIRCSVYFRGVVKCVRNGYP